MTESRDEVPAVATPSRRKIAEFRSVAITGLFILAVFYTLHLARDFVLPIVLALYLGLILQPLVRLLGRLRVPRAAAPALVLVLLLGGTATVVTQLWGPASEWVARAPQDLRQLESRLKRLLRTVESVTRTAERVGEITAVTPTEGTQQVEIKRKPMSEALLGGMWRGLVGALVVLVLAYFFMASGEQFLRKLPRALPRDQAERVITIVQEAEAQVSRYLIALTLINLGVGLATAGLMAFAKMPTPFLLGAVAALLNFVPYLGPFAMASLLGAVGLISLARPEQALLPVLMYLTLHALESNFITPHLLGRRLPLNPLVIFLSFLFWWWIWGVPGAILAVPIMVTVKIIADHTRSWAGVGEFLGR